jgi:hypothetical protein
MPITIKILSCPGTAGSSSACGFGQRAADWRYGGLVDGGLMMTARQSEKWNNARTGGHALLRNETVKNRSRLYTPGYCRSMTYNKNVGRIVEFCSKEFGFVGRLVSFLRNLCEIFHLP